MPGQKDGWRDRQTLFFRTLPATAGGSNKSSRMWYSDMDKEVAALHETSLSLKHPKLRTNTYQGNVSFNQCILFSIYCRYI